MSETPPNAAALEEIGTTGLIESKERSEAYKLYDEILELATEAAERYFGLAPGTVDRSIALIEELAVEPLPRDKKEKIQVRNARLTTAETFLHMELLHNNSATIDEESASGRRVYGATRNDPNPRNNSVQIRYGNEPFDERRLVSKDDTVIAAISPGAPRFEALALSRDTQDIDTLPLGVSISKYPESEFITFHNMSKGERLRMLKFAAYDGSREICVGDVLGDEALSFPINPAGRYLSSETKCRFIYDGAGNLAKVIAGEGTLLSGKKATFNLEGEEALSEKLIGENGYEFYVENGIANVKMGDTIISSAAHVDFEGEMKNLLAAIN